MAYLKKNHMLNTFLEEDEGERYECCAVPSTILLT